MVKVTNIKNNDEVFAKKELKMFGNVFANEGDCFKVYDINDNHVKITSDKIDLFLDTNTFHEHFEKKTIENNKSGYIASYDIDKTVQNVLDWSELDKYTAFDNHVVVSCKLPNGFIITESANTEKDCIEKIKNKIAELETYRIMTDEYEYDCWMEDVCVCDSGVCDCDDCSNDIKMADCFDAHRCLDCEDSDGCECYDYYYNR